MAETDAKTLLERLGLTEYEAKTLSTLFGMGDAEAPEISRRAEVPKTRVYDVLDRLTKRGLIIEISGRPKKYRVVDAVSVFGALIEGKKAEVADLEKGAESVKDALALGRGEEGGERVMKVRERGDFMRILAQEIGKAENSVFALADLGKEHGLLKDSLRKAAERKTEIRLISRIGEGSRKMAREFEGAGVKVRDCEHGMHAYVIDGKRVVLALSDFAKERPEYHFTIWPENRALAEALTNYFNTCWERGK